MQDHPERGGRGNPDADGGGEPLLQEVRKSPSGLLVLVQGGAEEELLVRLDPEKDATAVMSLPRDLKVTIPTKNGDVSDKITAAFIEGDALNDAFKRFKDLADRKKHVFDDDIIALVDEQLAAEGERIGFKRLRVVAGTDGPQTAEIDLIVDGEEKFAIARGNGPVDAVFNAIRLIVPHQAVLELYQVHAVTGGTDAQATVSVRLNGDGIMATGRSSDPDTLVASAKAYLHALNKFEVRKSKRKAA